MSTHSRIACQHPDGSIKSIYCHYDGYPSHNGKLLIEYWNNHEKAEALMSLGNLVMLGKTLGERLDHEKIEADLRSNACKAYGRDKEKNGQDAISHPNIDKLIQCYETYVYLYTDNRWYIFCDYEDQKGEWRELIDVLNEDKEVGSFIPGA